MFAASSCPIEAKINTYSPPPIRGLCEVSALLGPVGTPWLLRGVFARPRARNSGVLVHSARCTLLASAPMAVAVVVAAVAREAPRLGRAQVGGVGARREESNEEFREHV